MSKYSLGLLAVLFFLLGRIIENSANQKPDIEYYRTILEDKLKEREQQVQTVFEQHSFLLGAIPGDLSIDSMHYYAQLPFTLLIYNDKDSLVYWNNNQNLLLLSDLKYEVSDTNYLYEIEQSIFLRIRKPYTFSYNNKKFNYSLDALIPIFKSYPVQNDYLQDFLFLSEDQSLLDIIQIEREATPYPIRNSAGENLFYIQAAPKKPIRERIKTASLLYLLGSFLGYGMFLRFLKERKESGGRNNFFYWVLGVGLFRGFTVLTGFPHYFAQGDAMSILLGGSFYALGDVVIDSCLLLNGAINYLKIKKFRQVDLWSKEQKKLLVGTYYGLSLLSTVILFKLLMLLGQHQDISFNFLDYSSLGIATFWGLIGIGMLMLAYLVFYYRTALIISDFKQGRFEKQGVYFVVLSLITFVCITFGFVDSSFFIGIVGFNILVLSLMHFFVKRASATLAWIIIWLILASVFISLVSVRASFEKELEKSTFFVKQLAEERDNDLEQKMDSILPIIAKDGLLKLSLHTSLSPLSYKSTKRFLAYRYLDHLLFQKYNYKINIYTAQHKPFRGEKQPYEIIEERIRLSEGTSCPNMRHYSNYDGGWNYYVEIPIKEKGTVAAIIVLSLEPKDFGKNTYLYDALLGSKQGTEEAAVALRYDYALYKINELVKNKGKIPFVEIITPEVLVPLPGAILYRNEKYKNKYYTFCLYQNKSGGNVAVVATPSLNIGATLSVFAYIFFFYLLITFVAVFFFVMLNRTLGVELLGIKFKESLHEKIQRGILMISILSFIAIAVVAILNSNRTDKVYHQARLKRKVEAAARSAIWTNEGASTDFLLNATRLGKIHNVDINLFEINGDLLSSSQEIVFDRHFFSRKMNPMALHKLADTEQEDILIEKEKINGLVYLSAYVALKDKSNLTKAYLNVPYYVENNQGLNAQDIEAFLSTVLNVYVFFLLLIGLASFLIAKSITRPLSVIGAKLNNIQFGEKNDPIEWQTDDEIGVLIKQYNHMIEALEDSSKKLARSQRESAWRDMAKQVAHEIRNPLTPMKLNIQLLERVFNKDPEKAKKMVQRVSATLVEQIDSLAHIASEFSNFAQMPIANNESLALNNLVENAYALFKEEQNIELSLSLPKETCTVFADKNQIMRVLNNLIKNAIQAFPSDENGNVNITLKKKDNETAFILVKDDGCGIPIDKAEDIFTPNFTTKSSGTGIGLSMTKNIVEAIGGVIYFESADGIGTTFYVELPLEKTNK